MSNKTSPRPLSELDMATRKRLEEILALEPDHLAPSDRAFMRGRKAYLTEAQIADYATDEPAEPGDDEATDDDSYATWALADLKEEAKARGLEIEGNKNAKAPYVEALEADDAANGE